GRGARPPPGPGGGPPGVRGLRGHGPAPAGAHRGGGAPALRGDRAARGAPPGCAGGGRGQRGRGRRRRPPEGGLRPLPVGHRHAQGHRPHREEGVRARRRVVDGGARHLYARPRRLRARPADPIAMRWILETVWVLVVVIVPALGVWLASSLAVYRNGPVWLAVACGLLLFPGLPLAWAMWSRRGSDKEKKRREGRRYLSTWERLVIRTLGVNVLFITALVVRFPAASFAALATRGDWFLEGNTSADADTARRLLFATAGGLEWLYHAVRPNPYDDLLQKRAGDVPSP